MSGQRKWANSNQPHAAQNQERAKIFTSKAKIAPLIIEKFKEDEGLPIDLLNKITNELVYELQSR